MTPACGACSLPHPARAAWRETRVPARRGSAFPLPDPGTRGAKPCFLHRRRKHPLSCARSRAQILVPAHAVQPSRTRGASPPTPPLLLFCPCCRARALSSCARWAPRRRRHEPLFLGARYQPSPVGVWRDASPHFLSAPGLVAGRCKTPLAARAAGHEPPRSSRAPHTSIPAGPARREHPQETFLPARTIPPPSTRDASAPFLTTRCGASPCFLGAWRELPFLALPGPPGTGVLPRSRRVPQSRAVFPQLLRRGSPLAGPAASTGHGRAPLREPCALSSARSGPRSREARLQLGTEGSRARGSPFWERLRAGGEGDDRR